ncbi:unnamed protein product (macronuclear) [Paramecium tetraurelia]|uniref:Histidine kinase n=1 Tax=Paramecium tetraurelia TaxID=5888 RepID=A0DD19_PARTE|nr:uncharacterized protein GSPATT00015795001 [Paramecium tetraurelia]CAK80936.1 unnamed protein product [Paramecium tetraurelia]|eukprot:XP_001448333.1 hypothetical protein (macronuclear) [Paramecium tetraurelia strain d4-2]
MKELQKNSILKQWPHYQKILKSSKYSQWKQNDLVCKRSMFYHTAIALSAFYVLISLIVEIIEMENMRNIVQLTLFIVSEIVIICIYSFCKKIQIYFLIQYCLITVYILVTVQNEEKNKIFIFLYLILVNSHSNIIIKILLYLYFSFTIIFFYKLETLEVCIICIIAFIHNSQLELHFIGNYIKQLKLLSIIEQMPSAVCILDQNTKQITYSNQLFEKLAQTLQVSDELAQSINNSSKEQQQIDFIRNLNLEEIKNDGFQISDFIPQINDEGITDDQYKIVNVDFKRQPSQNTLQNVSFMCPNSASLKKKSKDIFSDINTNDYLLNSSRKSYVTTIHLQIQISHQPKSFILSAKTKRRKKSSNNMNLSKQSSRNLGQFSKVQDIQNSMYCDNLKLSPNHTETLNHNLVEHTEQFKCVNDGFGQQSSTSHKVRLMVNLIQISDVLNEEQDYQIYCINELSPLLLQYTVKKLEQAKKTIMRSLSHELRTSINAVNGYISEAYERIDNIQQLNKNLELSLKYINLMKLKLQDFFDYRDILEDQFELKVEKFDLNIAINLCVDLIKVQCQEKKLNLNVEMPSETIIAIGDKNRFQQVLINLLTNGIKFTQQGGITIQVSRDFQLDSISGLEEVREIKLQQLVQIRIIDSGIGMKEELKGILNKKFLYVDDDPKISKDSVGIGLGLSVCQHIIKAMGPQGLNSLFLESIMGGGSQFYFFLNYDSIKKYHSDQDIPESENKEQTIVRLSPTKRSLLKQIVTYQNDACNSNDILIVDDEHFNLDILANIIHNLNSHHKKYEITRAFNGSQALEKIKQKRIQNCCCLGFKAILMDINMPIMNGWDCAKQIRIFEDQYKVQRKIPIIAITGYSGKKDLEKCFKYGFDYVSTKPTDKQKILKIFQEFNI